MPTGGATLVASVHQRRGGGGDGGRLRPDQDGTPVRLSALRGGTVVVYFYPKADTPG